MPSRMTCPGCKRVGFVRQEHVIRGGFAAAAYDCGHCGYMWTVTESDARQKTRGERPGEQVRGSRKPDRSR
jgi:transposase-like protein